MDDRSAIIVIQTIDKSLYSCGRFHRLGRFDGVADGTAEEIGYQFEIITFIICENQRDRREIFCSPQIAQISAEIKALVYLWLTGQTRYFQAYSI